MVLLINGSPKAAGCTFTALSEVADTLEKEDIDILVTFGAGNIDRYIGPITEMMERRYGK